jgi:glycosyltransferase involved in cell wall biosynthesis
VLNNLVSTTSGERYCLTVAEILLELGWYVDLFWTGDKQLINQAVTRFSLKLEGLNIIPDIFGLKTTDIDSTQDQEIKKFVSHKSIPKSLLKKYDQTKNYDFIFFLNDGSIPFLFSKNNILHVQVPFATKISSKQKILNTIKSKFIKKIVCNSAFTASFIPQNLKSKVQIIYPPVDIESMQTDQVKQNIILSVGRFDNILNSKKQDVLIETFEKFVKQNPNTDWKLILMGGSRQEESNNHYLIYLKSLAKNLPIEFIVNPDFTKLKHIYSISKIYWHAAGYDVDQKIHPEQCEHFGITPVEAMASGMIPILTNKGGLPEIVTNGVDGYLWDDPTELLAKTQIVINTPVEFQKMQQKAIESSKQFSKENFKNKIIDLLKMK